MAVFSQYGEKILGLELSFQQGLNIHKKKDITKVGYL